MLCPYNIEIIGIIEIIGNIGVKFIIKKTQS